MPSSQPTTECGLPWQWDVTLSKVAPLGWRGLSCESSAAITPGGWGDVVFCLEGCAPWYPLQALWFLCLPSTQAPKLIASSHPGLISIPYHFHIQ